MTTASSDTLIRALLSPALLASKAYHVPDSQGLIKLDAMENPYPLPDALRAEWLASLSQAALNRYPDPHPQALIDTLKARLGLAPDLDLMLGNGSDELLQLLIMAVAGTRRPILAPEPSFAMYRILAEHLGLPFVGVPLNQDFQLDLPAFLQAITTHQPALIFLDWPNNPSGTLFAANDIEAIIAQAPGLVVVDEAYHPFSQMSFADRLGQSPNLLLLRTLSKEGLAGLRLGFLAGPAAWINQLDKLRLPYNINVLTQLSTGFYLRHAALLAEQAERIRAERERLYRAIFAMGFPIWPSAANFLLFQASGRASAIFTGLKAGGVLIKAFTGHPLLGDYLRVSIGKPEENDRFLAVLESLR